MIQFTLALMYLIVRGKLPSYSFAPPIMKEKLILLMVCLKVVLDAGAGWHEVPPLSGPGPPRPVNTAETAEPRRRRSVSRGPTIRFNTQANQQDGQTHRLTHLTLLCPTYEEYGIYLISVSLHRNFLITFHILWVQ